MLFFVVGDVVFEVVIVVFVVGDVVVECIFLVLSGVNYVAVVML